MWLIRPTDASECLSKWASNSESRLLDLQFRRQSVCYRYFNVPDAIPNLLLQQSSGPGLGIIVVRRIRLSFRFLVLACAEFADGREFQDGPPGEDIYRMPGLETLPYGKIKVDWDRGFLQSAPTSSGPWTELNVVAPLIVDGRSGSQFFRIRIR